MSQDIIFNQKKKESCRRKPLESCRHKSLDYKSFQNLPKQFMHIRSFEPLSKVYDYVSGYCQAEQKFVYGMVTQVIHSEGGWCYCVRPEKHDAFWTRLVM